MSVRKNGVAVALVAVLAVLLAPSVFAAGDASASGGVQRYVVELRDPPLASFDGGPLASAALVDAGERIAGTSTLATGASRLDVRTSRSQAYLGYLDRTHDAFRLDAAVILGRAIEARGVYRYAMNGMALDLTAAEAARLLKSPFVKSVTADTRHRLQTDAGPEWIGANALWSGQSGFTATRGEGIVVGIIDSGINWEHPSFADPDNDGYHFVNPYPNQLGLCSDPEVDCNNKLVGVYDFVVDDPATDDVVEENTKGRDNTTHGSHVSGIAVGNRLDLTLNGTINTQISGVAPHANLVAYRVCFVGDPPEADGGGCMSSAILSAIDQAIADGVDVINYSIGTADQSPWIPGSIPMAFLNARNAGIFISTSGGNAGPNAGTVGSPANAPWVSAAGNATHNRIFGSVVENLSGGGTTPPQDLVGASLTGGVDGRKIVHAKDYGFALCGTGESESGASCGANQGLSNPWKGTQPFHGEIVVCDRGDYGRVEKGKNVLLAGAGGYILANTDETGESLVSEDHCLPAAHIGDADGDVLRAWLASGSNHMGSISGFVLAEADKFGDILNSSSSRGPTGSPVQDTLKPNLIAPGTDILSSSDVNDEFAILTGTSMASPHVAGAAALVRAVHPGWTVSQVVSALQTTATAALAKDADGSVATPHERGAGRPRLGLAVDAGLYLNVTGAQFAAANPSAGGNPKTLNLPALVDSSCFQSCTFSRTVTDQMGGGSWTATALNFPAGTQVTISPAKFTLGNGASQTLNITINLLPTAIVGAWVYGDIKLSAAGSADQVLTTAVYSYGGTLPAEWVISDDGDSGYKDFDLSGLVTMPDVTITSGGLVAPTRTTQKLLQDPSGDDAFDGGAGVVTVWHNLPQGGLWLHAETLVSSADDVDLFVGRDDNQDGIADAEETLCESLSPLTSESCDVYDLPQGNYWVLVQNFDGRLQAGDETTFLSAAVEAASSSPLYATGPGIVTPVSAPFKVRTSWDNVNALPGDQWLGAVGIGTRRNTPNDIGVIPVRFNRTGIAAPRTLPLANGKTQKLAVAANSNHSRLFIDIPASVTGLTVAAAGNDSAQNNALKIELFREDFSTALGTAPFAQLADGLPAIGTATGAGGAGPAVSLTGALTPGRYFVRLSNTSGAAIPARITATATSSSSNFSPQLGPWDYDRQISQGIEWNRVGSNYFTLWYTYDVSGQPTWFIAAGPVGTGNIWTADLLYVTNDGAQQQEKKVGQLTVTFVESNKMIYSYSMLGQAGFEGMHPLGPNTCPVIGGGVKSYTGSWSRSVAGLGGATVIVYASAQAQIHYLFDSKGEPRWLIAADDQNQSATAEVIPLLQFKGYCPTCSPAAISSSEVGEVTRTFSSQTAGSWNLDFTLVSPLVQNLDRTDSVVKLSETLTCQ